MNQIESKSNYNDENEFHIQNDNGDENTDNNESIINQNDLSNKDWYWSTISRAQANDLLHGKHFL